MADIVVDSPDAPVLLSTQEVAFALGVSDRTVHRLAAAGRLRRLRLGHRVVRYTLASVEALVLDNSFNNNGTPADTDAPSKRDWPAPHAAV